MPQRRSLPAATKRPLGCNGANQPWALPHQHPIKTHSGGVTAAPVNPFFPFKPRGEEGVVGGDGTPGAPATPGGRPQTQSRLDPLADSSAWSWLPPGTPLVAPRRLRRSSFRSSSASQVRTNPGRSTRTRPLPPPSPRSPPGLLLSVWEGTDGIFSPLPGSAKPCQPSAMEQPLLAPPAMGTLMAPGAPRGPPPG